MRFSNPCLRTAAVKFVLTMMFHPGSPLEDLFLTIVPFHFSFSTVFAFIVEISAYSNENRGIDICSGMELVDFEYAKDVAIITGDLSKLHIFAKV